MPPTDSHLTEAEQRHIREVAKAIVREMDAAGHFCFRAQDWGEVKADMATVKNSLISVESDVKIMRDEMAAMRGERRAVVAIVGFVGALFGGLLSALFAG